MCRRALQYGWVTVHLPLVRRDEFGNTHTGYFLNPGHQHAYPIEVDQKFRSKFAGHSPPT